MNLQAKQSVFRSRHNDRATTFMAERLRVKNAKKEAQRALADERNRAKRARSSGRAPNVAPSDLSALLAMASMLRMRGRVR